MARIKRPSLVHQVVERLKSMDCRGQSRHKAKAEYREQLEAQGKKHIGNRVPGKIFQSRHFRITWTAALILQSGSGSGLRCGRWKR